MTPDMFPDDVTNPEQYEGCELECADDEILIADTRYGGHWYCLKKIGPMPMICPGGFNTECGCSGTDADCPIGECECEGQVRINNDCTYAKICKDGCYEEFTCEEEDEIIMVDMTNLRFSCGKDDTRCPGAFHVGCNTDTRMVTGEDILCPSNDTTTTTSTSTTTTTASTTSTPSFAMSYQLNIVIGCIAILFNVIGS